MDFTIENNSGQGKNSTLPPEIKGWNWGAFFLNWIWGIGNSTFIALLMFVPIVNFAMPFVLGAKAINGRGKTGRGAASSISKKARSVGGLPDSSSCAWACRR